MLVLGGAVYNTSVRHIHIPWCGIGVSRWLKWLSIASSRDWLGRGEAGAVASSTHWCSLIKSLSACAHTNRWEGYDFIFFTCVSLFWEYSVFIFFTSVSLFWEYSVFIFFTTASFFQLLLGHLTDLTCWIGSFVCVLLCQWFYLA